MSSMMGKPTVDATVDGLHMQAWILTQKRHKELMKKNMGEMMMHGEKNNDMDMMGKKDTSMGMGKDMMSMTHDGMMDKAMVDSMKVGTHFIMLDVAIAANMNELLGASATLFVASPSKKTSSVYLRPMMKHFGAGLKFKEKGNYQLTMSVKVTMAAQVDADLEKGSYLRGNINTI